MFIVLLSEANIPDSVGGPGRHEDQAKDAQASARQMGKLPNSEALWSIDLQHR